MEVGQCWDSFIRGARSSRVCERKKGGKDTRKVTGVDGMELDEGRGRRMMNATKWSLRGGREKMSTLPFVSFLLGSPSLRLLHSQLFAYLSLHERERRFTLMGNPVYCIFFGDRGVFMEQIEKQNRPR